MQDKHNILKSPKLWPILSVTPTCVAHHPIYHNRGQGHQERPLSDPHTQFSHDEPTVILHQLHGPDVVISINRNINKIINFLNAIIILYRIISYSITHLSPLPMALNKK